jgi:hypothetical protein
LQLLLAEKAQLRQQLGEQAAYIASREDLLDELQVKGRQADTQHDASSVACCPVRPIQVAQLLAGCTAVRRGSM